MIIISAGTFLILWIIVLVGVVLLKIRLWQRGKLWKIDSTFNREEEKSIRRKMIVGAREHSRIYRISLIVGALGLLFIIIGVVFGVWCVLNGKIFIVFSLAALSSVVPLSMDVGAHGSQYYYWMKHPISHVTMVSRPVAKKILQLRVLQNVLVSCLFIYPVFFQREFMDLVVLMMTKF